VGAPRKSLPQGASEVVTPLSTLLPASVSETYSNKNQHNLTTVEWWYQDLSLFGESITYFSY